MDLIDRDELRMIVYATERCNGKTALIEALNTIINNVPTACQTWQVEEDKRYN